jgi:exopolysaccharide biosynthesis polyprenyl glycosylphosphotransferase
MPSPQPAGTGNPTPQVSLGARWIREKRSRPGQHPETDRNVLIIGTGKAGRGLAAYFTDHPLTGCVVRGFLDDSEPTGGEVLGRLDDLARVALAEFVDDVVLTGPYERDLAERVVREAQRNRLRVRVFPELFGLDPKSVALERVGGLPVLRVQEDRNSALAPVLKRAIDVVLSIAALVVTAPLLGAVALAIGVDSDGPVLYRARRVGKKGRVFFCYKFRTMVAQADREKELLRQQNERQGPIFKIAKDPRITRVGEWLRRYSLDELPQLWNVLRDEMSLVGPRPHPLDDCEHYDLEHLRRLEVKPGITGLWQVTARNDPSFERNMALDMEYIEHWSLGMDLKILCKTISAVLQGNGT